MSEVKPWEEPPDDGYWRALLSESAEQTPSPTVMPTAATTPRTGGENTRGETMSVPSQTESPFRKATGGWALAEKSYAHGDTLELRVVGYNRGGVLIDLGDVRGFVPASQLLTFPRQVQEEERMQELERYVNRSLHLKVIEFDRARNRLILSERIANPPVPRADQVLATIQPKQTRKGVIRNVTDFGAFVDLGGVEGLIHVSEFSWQRVVHPRDMLAPGQEVEVYVMDVDREQKRIACSLRRTTPNPWAQIAGKVHPGDQVEGVITNVVSFGAFVRIADGVEGLIHISELAEGNFLHPRDVVREGQSVQVRVVSVDPVRQRIGLSLRNGASSENSSGADSARRLSKSSASLHGELRAQIKSQTSPDDPPLPPPPPPDAGYWESLARSGA